MQFSGLCSFAELERQFGRVVESRDGVSIAEHDLVGQRFRDLVAETTEIVAHQWNAGVARGAVRGFFLAGPPGVGKTTLVRRVAYELCSRFPARDSRTGESEVVLVPLDGAEIARARYGESEERIREIFSRAARGFTEPGQRSVLLFDDVESILMARGSENAKEWHFSQDSVFFHAVDELDTSRATVFLTSNRPDLVDHAILDRFLTYTLEVPAADVLVGIAQRRAEEQGLSANDTAALVERVRELATAGLLHSIRDAERLVVQFYVERILKRPSTAAIGFTPHGR